MHQVLFRYLLVLLLGFTRLIPLYAQQSGLFGKWIPVKLEINGAALPESSFITQQLILADSNYLFIAESVDKGIVKYTDNKMDIYGKEGVNAGKHFTALYTLEKELLTICYNLAGDKYPESFETKGKPTFFLAVFKKAEMK
jgi:uncharacterized protein (TIGR03067 family)